MQLKTRVQYMQVSFNGEPRRGVLEALPVPCDVFRVFFGFRLRFRDGDGDDATGGDEVLCEETLLLP
jgi:hypothetical protein